MPAAEIPRKQIVPICKKCGLWPCAIHHKEGGIIHYRGLCSRCKAKQRHTTDRQRSVATDTLSRTRLWELRCRLEAVRYYSNGLIQCAHCPERRLLALDIDHIHGGGHQLRTIAGGHGRYNQMVAEADYSKYRILCRNCNRIAHYKLHNLHMYDNDPLWNVIIDRVKAGPIQKWEWYPVRDKWFIRQLKLAVLALYSDYKLLCTSCLENRVPALDIDHICGGGRQLYTAITSATLLRRYLAEYDKSKYGVLCQNCNWIKHITHNYPRNMHAVTNLGATL